MNDRKGRLRNCSEITIAWAKTAHSFWLFTKKICETTDKKASSPSGILGSGDGGDDDMCILKKLFK